MTLTAYEKAQRLVAKQRAKLPALERLTLERDDARHEVDRLKLLRLAATPEMRQLINRQLLPEAVTKLRALNKALTEAKETP